MMMKNIVHKEQQLTQRNSELTLISNSGKFWNGAISYLSHDASLYENFCIQCFNLVQF